MTNEYGTFFRPEDEKNRLSLELYRTTLYAWDFCGANKIHTEIEFEKVKTRYKPVQNKTGTYSPHPLAYARARSVVKTQLAKAVTKLKREYASRRRELAPVYSKAYDR